MNRNRVLSSHAKKNRTANEPTTFTCSSYHACTCPCATLDLPVMPLTDNCELEVSRVGAGVVGGRDGELASVAALSAEQHERRVVVLVLDGEPVPRPQRLAVELPGDFGCRLALDVDLDAQHLTAADHLLVQVASVDARFHCFR